MTERLILLVEKRDKPCAGKFHNCRNEFFNQFRFVHATGSRQADIVADIVEFLPRHGCQRVFQRAARRNLPLHQLLFALFRFLLHLLLQFLQPLLRRFLKFHKAFSFLN